MPPFQIYVNDEKYGPHHWSLTLVKELCSELAETNEKVYAIHIASGNKMYQHPSPFTHE